MRHQLAGRNRWLRITLSLDTGADRYFVAITDAVPDGLRPTDLALSGVAGLVMIEAAGPASAEKRAE